MEKRKAGYVSEVVAGVRHAAANGGDALADQLDTARRQLSHSIRRWGHRASARVDRAGRTLVANVRRLNDAIEPDAPKPQAQRRARAVASPAHARH